MTVRSTGNVRLDEGDPLGHPVIDMHMLEDDQDRRAMREAIEVMIDVLRSPSFDDILAEVVVDDAGTDLQELRTPREPMPGFADVWATTSMPAEPVAWERPWIRMPSWTPVVHCSVATKACTSSMPR
jgi:hypothetical protein